MGIALKNFLRRLLGTASSSSAQEVAKQTDHQSIPALATPGQPALPPETPVSAPVQPAASAPLPDISATPLSVSAPPLPVALTAWKPALPIDSLFFDWMMGNPGQGSDAALEQKVLQALFALLASDLNDAVVIPRMPSIIPQLLASLRNKTVSASELSGHIIKDVVLVGEVIRTVNSALYNPADRINSLEKAVMMLGEEGLRLVIAKVAFSPIINLSSGHYTRRVAPAMWSQSEKCAIACRYLAQDTYPFQAFLTGMMKNVGMIIAFRLLDQVGEQTKFHYSRGFQQTFNSVAATLSYRIAQRWNFPSEVLQALQQQTGGSKSVAWSELGQLLQRADLISKMRILVNHAQLKSNDERLKIGLDATSILCFDTLNEIPLYELNGLQPPNT